MASVAIVTGAGRGMGKACAAQLVDTVDVMLLVDRDESALEATVAELSCGEKQTTAIPFTLDITDVAALENLSQRVTDLGVLRAVVHAAGISPTMADWRRVLEVDLVGSARVLHALTPTMSAGTAIVCFASIASVFLADVESAMDAALDDPLHPAFLDRLGAAVGPALEETAYAWAKRGVQRLVQREAVSLGRRGARICSVSPGIIDTPMGRQEAATRPINDFLTEQTPMGREGHPDEVAAVVAFLLSETASFVNGIDVTVDGGLVAALRTNDVKIPGV